MIRSFFIVILIIWVNSSIFGQQDDLEKSLAAAQIQINIGDYSRALLTLEDILVKQPDNLKAQEMKINILVEEDRTKDALRDIEQHIAMYPGHPEYVYLRGVLYLQKEKFSKAIEDFDRAIQMDMPGEYLSKVYLNRGLAHYHNQDYEEAEADFSEVLTLDPKNAAAYHGRGMVKYDTQEYEEAIVEFQHALKIEGDNPITHYNLAMSYFRLDDEENACYHFNKSCALGHRNACRLLMMECDINITE